MRGGPGLVSRAPHDLADMRALTRRPILCRHIVQRRSIAQNTAGDGGAVDLRSAVEDAVDSRIAVIAFDRQILAEPHAAEDLHRAIHDTAKRFRGLRSEE